ncbi:hypothetical protein [Rhodococcus sp. IEGM1428]|uniref:hypothetical protein n=1 Tax=Rhodococcus sp. IEGM1428 TaxID=3392191 RepID=UPI003D0F4F86
MNSDPFSGLQDQKPPTPDEAVQALLDAGKRGYVTLRNVLAQHPPGTAAGTRDAKLAEFVTRRQERALDAFLLLHALQPVGISADPLPLGAWANLLSTRNPCSVTTVSKTFRILEDMDLITRRRRGPSTVIEPLHEDGSKDPWFRPGSNSSIKEGFFTLPHEYWTSGYADQLRLPGKAMLLIILKETQSPTRPTFSMAVERAKDWYGISERTAERGYKELGDLGLIDTRIQLVASPKLPANVRRQVYHRALRDPFSTARRVALQRTAARVTRTPAPPSTGRP